MPLPSTSSPPLPIESNGPLKLALANLGNLVRNATDDITVRSVECLANFLNLPVDASMVPDELLRQADITFEWAAIFGQAVQSGRHEITPMSVTDKIRAVAKLTRRLFDLTRQPYTDLRLVAFKAINSLAVQVIET